MYPIRDINGKITGHTKWPNDQTSTSIDNESQEWMDYLNPPATQADYIQAIQDVLDSKSIEMGYDNIFTAVTYADESGVAKFQQEGQALRKWRSLAWEYAYDVLGQVEQGIITIPTVEDFVAGMPAYE